MKNKIFIESAFTDIYQETTLTFIDVGGVGGIPERWKRAEKYLHVVGFEPDPDEVAGLMACKRKNNTFINASLYDDDRVIDFYVTKQRNEAL